MKKKSKILEPNHYNWHIFPIYGIDVIQEEDWYEHPFEDVYLINKEELIKFVSENSLSKLEHEVLTFPFSKNGSYILVKTKFSPQEFQQALIDEAYGKAINVVSILFLYYLYFSKYQYGVCMDKQLYYSNGLYCTSLFVEQKSKRTHNTTLNFEHTKGELVLKIPSVNFSLSSDFIKEFSKQPIFKNILKLFVKSIDINLRNSVLNLYLSLNTNIPQFQFLGCIVSLEILYNLEGPKNQLALQKILSVSTYDKDFKNTKSLFDTRNDIVHKGKECSRKDVYQILQLLLRSYFLYSNLKDFKCSVSASSLIIYIFDLNKNDEDFLDTLTKWKSLKIEHDKTDWVKLSLLNFYSLNSNSRNDKDNLNFCYCVCSLIQLGICSSTNESFEAMLLYVIVPERFSIINSFVEFEKFYFENISEIEEKTSDYLKNQNFRLD